MKKIIVIITTSFVSWGGLTNAFLNYYRHMNMKDMHVDIASTNAPSVELLTLVEQMGGRYFNLGERKNFFSYILNLYKILRNNKYGVIHVNGNSATMVLELLVAKICAIPIRIAHGHSNRTEHPIINFFLKKPFYRLYTHGIACSKQVGDWLYSGREYIIIKNAIDIQLYEYRKNERERIREELGVNDQIVIGHVGKFYEAKNHKFLLEVFKRLHTENDKISLVLIGDGKLRGEIEEWINLNKMGSYIHLLGMKENANIYYNAFDVFVFPSIYEGFGLAALEAQCNGLKCIFSEAVTKETRVLADTQYLELEIELWVKNIKEAIGNLSFYNRESKSEVAVQKIVEVGFSCEREAEKLKRVYMN